MKIGMTGTRQGLTKHQDRYAMMGIDWDEVYEQLAA